MKLDVLVVDDDSYIRESLCEILELEGYAPHEAENGLIALNLIRGGLKPRLILLDLMMPVMDGILFRQKQLENEEWATFPVIIFSAHGDVRTRLPVVDKNLPLILKPPDIDFVISMVKRHVKIF